MLSRRPLAVLLAACALLPVTACGGDAEEKNAYVDEVQTAQRAYADSFTTVVKRLTPTSTASQDRATLGAFEQATARFGGTLGKVDPPDDVKQQHGVLVAAVARFRSDLDEARAGLEGVPEKGAARARVRTQLSSSAADTQRRLGRAIADLNVALRD